MTKTKNVVTFALLLVVLIGPDSIVFAQTPVDAITDTAGTADDKSNNKISDGIIDPNKNSTVLGTTLKNDVGVMAHLEFKGQADGWIILNGTASESSTTLSGDAYSMVNGHWNIKSVGDIKFASKIAKIDLSGFTRGNRIYLQGTGTLSDDEAIKIHLMGHFAPTSNSSVYAIAFTNASVQYAHDKSRIQLMQVGSVTITPVPPTTGPLPITPINPTTGPLPITPIHPTTGPLPITPIHPTTGPLPITPIHPTTGPLPITPIHPTTGPLPITPIPPASGSTSKSH